MSREKQIEMAKDFCISKGVNPDLVDKLYEGPFGIAADQPESLFSAELKSKFKLRSQLPKHVEAGMRMLVITGDVIDMHVKGETVANMLDLIIPQLPADVFLCDDHYSGGVIYPLPMFNADGSSGYCDAYCLILGSLQWKNPGPGKMIPMLDVFFTKDPTTWAVTAKVVERTENVK